MLLLSANLCAGQKNTIVSRNAGEEKILTQAATNFVFEQNWTILDNLIEFFT